MDRRTARKLLSEEQVRLEGMRATVAEEHLGNVAEREAFSELSAVDQHPADTGTEFFERQKDRSILSQVEAEIADIHRALARVDAGTYGACEACGKPVGEARLQAKPSARFCIDDQARLEREARPA